MSAPPRHAPRPRLDPPRARETAQLVTATDLVRNFRHWQRRAAHAPVYVLFRGRPRLVLTSIEVMEALLAPHLPDRRRGAPDATVLLELIHEIVVIVDADLRIVTASRAARDCFGAAVAPGGAVEALAPPPSRATLLRAVRQVHASGETRSVDMPSPTGGAQLLAFTIAPHAHGVALLVSELQAATLRNGGR